MSSIFPPHFIQACHFLITSKNGNEVTQYWCGIRIGLCAWIFQSCHHKAITQKWIIRHSNIEALFMGIFFFFFRENLTILPLQSLPIPCACKRRLFRCKTMMIFFQTQMTQVYRFHNPLDFLYHALSVHPREKWGQQPFNFR